MHEMICCLLFCLMFLTLYHFSTFVLNSSSWSFKWQDEIIRIQGNVSDIQRPKRIIFDRFLKEKGGGKTLENIVAYNVLPDNLSPSLGNPMAHKVSFLY